MGIGRVDYGAWMLRVVSWDGLLPIAIGLVPYGIELLVPNRRGVMEVAAVALPIAAFFFRIVAGSRQIDSNRCSAAVRCVQFCSLCLAIFPLVLVDAFLILSHLMPGAALVVTKDEALIGAVLIAAYLLLMAVAMYPGRASPSPSDWDDGGRGGGPEWAWRTEWDGHRPAPLEE